jgi:hypothetical protein
MTDTADKRPITLAEAQRTARAGAVAPMTRPRMLQHQDYRKSNKPMLSPLGDSLLGLI